MAIPSGRRSSDPIPRPRASGSAPRSAAIVVIMIGRKRSTHAWWIASAGLLPSPRSASRAKSIIMIAFFFTMPTRGRMPIRAMTGRSLRHARTASDTPHPARGQVGQDGERVDVALVEHPEDDVYREERRRDQPGLAG